MRKRSRKFRLRLDLAASASQIRSGQSVFRNYIHSTTLPLEAAYNSNYARSFGDLDLLETILEHTAEQYPL